jgi:hypothetical protein
VSDAKGTELMSELGGSIMYDMPSPDGRGIQ